MKKVTLIFVSTIIMLFLIACSNESINSETTTIKESFSSSDLSENALTLDNVKELAKKGDALTWSDFEKYPHKDIGSGTYIYHYSIDEKYELVIGGPSLNEKPSYIRLCSISTDKEIDIRTNDVDEFISNN